jgi:predicted transposase/invertase (TIGR01784 family)
MHLANLDNEVWFKKVFTDPEIFRAFVHDVTGVDVVDAKIETEKVLERKVAAIRFKLDIFAESTDHRVLIEIQRIDYDHNFHRFLHYFLAALIDLQRSYKDYGFAREVYAIVVITVPYIVKDRTGEPIKDDILVSDFNPRTLQNEVRDIFPHKLIFLNPTNIHPGTPVEIADWLQLIHESIVNPEDPDINLSNPMIQKAAEIANIDNMDGDELEEAKIAEMRKQTMVIYEEKGREEGKLEREEELVVSAYERGKTIFQISDAFGFSEEKVKSILTKNGKVGQ